MCMLACSRIFVVSLSTYLECGLASTKVKKNSEEVEKKGQRKRKTARNGGREREQGGKKGKKDLPRTGLANHSRWAQSGLLPISVHSFLGTHPRTRTCVRCCVLQWPSWAVTPETHWPTKLKMLTLWHFPETVCWPLIWKAEHERHPGKLDYEKRKVRNPKAGEGNEWCDSRDGTRRLHSSEIPGSQKCLLRLGEKCNVYM